MITYNIHNIFIRIVYCTAFEYQRTQQYNTVITHTIQLHVKKIKTSVSLKI